MTLFLLNLIHLAHTMTWDEGFKNIMICKEEADKSSEQKSCNMGLPYHLADHRDCQKLEMLIWKFTKLDRVLCMIVYLDA